MAYRLAKHESLSTGIPRVLGEELAAAVRNLRKGTAGIHEARKSIKKLRGVLRMLEPRLGQLAAQETTALGNTSRSLGAARDNGAVIEIVDLLAQRSTATASTRSLTALRNRLMKRPLPPAATAETALQDLAQIRGRISEWPTMPDNFGPILDGLRETYRRGRKALRAVQAQPEPDAFHTLRKRAKDHWYQVRLFEGIWAGEPREVQLRELQECLGDDQNLTVLEQNADLGPTVRKTVDKARAELRARALALAAEIYAEKPREHQDRVLALWDGWRGSRKGPASAPAQRRHQAAA